MISALFQQVAYRLYAYRLRKQLEGAELPKHVGLIMDGNRRWARQMGLENQSLGHKYGAEHFETVLSWCEKTKIKHVTVYVCSTENLSRREPAEVSYLMDLIETVIRGKLTKPGSRWQVHIAGTLDVLPDSTARTLKDAVEATRESQTGHHVTLAIGYGGRQEVVDALRAVLDEHAAAGGTLSELANTMSIADISRHLYTVGEPDPDLVIRTSGEQRLSNFLLWQSAYSELYFCDTTGPRSARSTSCEHSAVSLGGTAATEADPLRLLGLLWCGRGRLGISLPWRGSRRVRSGPFGAWMFAGAQSSASN